MTAQQQHAIDPVPAVEMTTALVIAARNRGVTVVDMTEDEVIHNPTVFFVRDPQGMMFKVTVERSLRKRVFHHRPYARMRTSS